MSYVPPYFSQAIPNQFGVYGETAIPLYGYAPIFNVRNWGAKGDGTDDTTAIQDTLDACDAAGGGVVQFNHTHAITETLNWHRSCRLSGGMGAPGGVVTGNPGDIYLNKAGGAATTLYVKESGTGTTAGWVGK